jgi:hypothetical protein
MYMEVAATAKKKASGAELRGLLAGLLLGHAQFRLSATLANQSATTKAPRIAATVNPIPESNGTTQDCSECNESN